MNVHYWISFFRILFVTMSRAETLSLALIEHDINDDDLCVWTFPGMSPTLQSVCIKRVSTEGRSAPFIFFKVKNDWIYAFSFPMPKDVVPDVTSASMCISSRTYDPEKYSKLCTMLAEQYRETGDPTKILEGYLSIHSTGKFINKIGTYDSASFKDTDPILAVTCLKDLVAMLGIEFVVLWNAMLLKKRILITSDTPESLFPVLRSLPLLAWHRKDFSVLRPLVRSDPEHLEDLTTSGVFVAGTVDDALASRSDIYDVLLSLSEGRITVTTHAVAEMKLCQIHKELAGICQEVAASGDDLDVLKAIAKKTSSTISQLRSIADGAKLTEAAIVERVSNEAAQQWLVKLAMAEGLL